MFGLPSSMEISKIKYLSKEFPDAQVQTVIFTDGIIDCDGIKAQGCYRPALKEIDIQSNSWMEDWTMVHEFAHALGWKHSPEMNKFVQGELRKPPFNIKFL